MAVEVGSPLRTVKQIVDKDGTPFQATLTSNVWVGHAQVFSHPQAGNKITSFVTGKEYFADLVTTMRGAESEICILGWQVNWDALLAPGLRLYDVLLAAAKKKTVKIYVMPWDDTKPMLTYDTQTQAVLESINNHPDVKSKQVQVLLSKSFASKNNSYFSHHQKQVIVDRKIAYIGGIDLAYGRYDDAAFDLNLRADSSSRQVLNRYNPCVPTLQTISTDHLVNPDLMTGFNDSYLRNAAIAPTNEEAEIDKIRAGGWQMPYATPGKYEVIKNSTLGEKRTEENTPLLKTLDPARQPRMPWQDVHSRIEGPTVADLLRNFVTRWNASGGIRLDMPKPPASYEKKGNAHIQVLRSAPATMRDAEYKAIIPKNGAKASEDSEDDIHRAMVQLIEKSSRFIYIENQFFVSAFGDEAATATVLSPAAQFINTAQGDDQNKTAGEVAMLDSDYHINVKRKSFKATVEINDSNVYKPPSNKVCKALIARIERAILDKDRPKFHVYITLPVHPEGSFMSTASIAVQVYWTMQTIAFGSNSLLNGIRRALKAKELHDKNDPDFRRVIDHVANTEYLSIPIEACFEYVTLLNLRNWTKLGDGKDTRYVTEQIYVHTKLMIVDDLYALLGSANINDRSLLGERDSEIAILVMDGDNSRSDICGIGSQRPVRTYAHELRKKVWSKLFGITSGVRPARHLQQAIDQPGIPDSWRSIQKQAEFNAVAYEEAFSYIPRNWTAYPKGDHKEASIIPNWDLNAENPKTKARDGYPASPLPFQNEFWDAPRHTPSGVGKLNGIKGFITALPIHWTAGEMNRFKYATAMVVQNTITPESQIPAAKPESSTMSAQATPSDVQPAQGEA